MSFGFATPGFLALLVPAIGLLVYAYLNRGKAKRQLVSSTIIFKQIKNRPTIRQKVKFPLRFFYELLLLSILILAIAGFYWQAPSRYWQIVIDNSLSLSAIDTNTKKNILALNIEQILNDRSNRFSNHSGVKVCLTSPSYHCWSESFQSWDQVSSKFNQIELFASNDLLESALSSIKIAPEVDLTIYSDYLTNSRQANNLRLATSRTGPLGNLVVKDILIKDYRLASVEVKSFALTPVQKYVRLYFLSYSNGSLVVNRVEKTKFKLEPGETTFVDFRFPLDTQAFIAEIEQEEVYSGTDSILADNFFYQIIQPDLSEEVLLVSEEQNLKTGLELVFQDQIKKISPSDFEAKKEKDINSALIIFNNYIPKYFPSVNHLIISSNAQPGVVSVAVEKVGKITKWDKQSPLLRYLSPDNFSFKTVWAGILPDWYHPIITSNHQSILAAGYFNQARSVYLGFPILPLEKDKNQELSILTLNILKWLKEKPEAPTNKIAEGFFYRLNNGKLESKNLADEHNFDWGFVVSKDVSEPSFIAKNFYQEEESNLRVMRKISLPSIPEAKGSGGMLNSNPNIGTLIIIVLLMFFGALLIWRKGER